MTDRLERLINLVIALRETRIPLQAAEIRERVAGYGQDDHEAFRRMFERDKADLRQLGVPIETAPVDVWGDRFGYRIDPASYDLPPLSFEPDELAALALAVNATQLTDEAGEGLRKLEVDAGLSGLRAPHGAARVDLGAQVPNRDTLIAAQISRTTVTFTYQPPGRRKAKRTVDPYALVHRAGRWYLVGHDHNRKAQRAFRLDRIIGTVHTAEGTGMFSPPAEPIDVDAVIPETAAVETAQVAASPEVAWQIARRAQGEGSQPEDGPEATDGWTVFNIGVGNRTEFCRWLREFGPEVRLLAPADLVTEFTQSLNALLQSVKGQSA